MGVKWAAEGMGRGGDDRKGRVGIPKALLGSRVVKGREGGERPVLSSC